MSKHSPPINGEIPPVPTNELRHLLYEVPLLGVLEGVRERPSDDVWEAHGAVCDWFQRTQVEGQDRPIPMLELWKLVKRLPLPRCKDGTPLPGSEDVHEIHATVYAWVARTELELGCPSYANSRDLSEFHEERRILGLCPKCRKNDGYLWLMDEDEYWGICHRHRSRWKVDFESIRDGFVPDGTEEWEHKKRPVSKYWVVKPLRVAEPEEDEWPRVPYHLVGPDGYRFSEKPKLSLVPPPAPDPTAGEVVSSEGGTAWETIRFVLWVVFIKLPLIYLEELRDKVYWAVGDYFLTPRQIAARAIALERGWYFILPQRMK